MTEPVRIKIAGRDVATDAPTVEDLLEQVRDIVGLLEGADAAISGTGQHDMVWRVTDASKNSPLELELTAYPREYGTDINARDAAVRAAVGTGLSTLSSRGIRPAYFDDDMLERAERVFRRVTNGLGLSSLDVGNVADPIVITPLDARLGANAAARLRKPPDEPYSELGSIECRFRSLDLDGRGPKLLRVVSRIDGAEVRVTLLGQALSDIERREVAELWASGQRLRLHGTINFRGPGKIASMTADAVEFVPNASHLPGVEDIIDPDFTDGLTSEEHLRRLRGGENS